MSRHYQSYAHKKSYKPKYIQKEKTWLEKMQKWKDVFPQANKKKFKHLSILGGGASPSIQIIEHIETQQKWVAKCDSQGIYQQSRQKNGKLRVQLPNNLSQIIELIALEIYGLFGVKIPPSSFLMMFPLTQQGIDFGQLIIPQNYQLPQSYPRLQDDRLHLVTKFQQNLNEFGDSFLPYYKNENKINKLGRYKIHEKELNGFGRIIAVAGLLFDFDFLGASGKNLGYIDSEQAVEVFKIDAGGSFSFLTDMEDYLQKKQIHTDRNLSIKLDQMKQADQKQFIETLISIMELPSEYLQMIFYPFREDHSKIKEIERKFLERKQKFLDTFTPESKELLKQKIIACKKNLRENALKNWKERKIDLKMEIRQQQQNLIKLIPKETYDSKKFQLNEKPKKFVGRKKIKQMIKEKLKQNKIICLVGQGGIGKSSLAQILAYEWTRQSEQNSIIWFYASLDLDHQIRTFLSCKLQIDPKQMNQNEINGLFTKSLSTKTLMILDDINDEETFKKMQKFKVKTMMTSRNPTFENCQKIEVPNLSKKEIQEYLFTKNQNQRKYNKNEAEILLSTLGGLPLAIEQAKKFLESNREVSVEEYRELLSHFPREQNQNKDEVYVFSTGIPSLYEVHRIYGLPDKLLIILACFSPHNIQISLINEFMGEDMNFLLSKLDEFSLIKIKKSSFQIHRLTQLCIQNILQSNKSFKEEFRKLGKWLTQRMQAEPDEEKYIEKAKRFFNHCQNYLTLSFSQPETKQNLIENIRLMLMIFSYQIKFEKTNAAKSNVEEAIKKYKNLFQGQQNLLLSQLLSMLGIAFLSEGKTQNALENFNESYAIQEKYLQNQDILCITSLANIAACFSQKANYHKTKEILAQASRKLMRLRRKIAFDSGKKEMGYSDILSQSEQIQKIYLIIAEGKSQVLINLENNRGALFILNKILEIKQKKYGPEHISLVETLCSLGIVLGRLEDIGKRAQILERASKIASKHGKQENSLHILSGLSMAYLYSGDEKRAIHLCGRIENTIKKMRNKKLAFNELQIADIQENLGLAYFRIQQYEKAREIFKRIFETKKRLYEPDNIKLAFTLQSMASVHEALNQFEQCKQLIIQSIEITIKNSGPQNPQLGSAYVLLGSAEKYLKFQQNAKLCFQRGLHLLEQLYGKTHTKIASGLSKLAYFQMQTLQISKAIELFSRLVQINHNTRQYRGLPDSVYGLAKSYLLQGNYQKSKELFFYCLILCQEFKGYKGENSKIIELAKFSTDYVCMSYSHMKLSRLFFLQLYDSLFGSM